MKHLAILKSVTAGFDFFFGRVIPSAAAGGGGAGGAGAGGAVAGGAKLNDKDYLEELIKAVQTLNATFKVSKPILLKIAPDLNEAQLDEIIELVQVTKIEGIIASNTSVSRTHLKTPQTSLANARTNKFII